MAEDKQGEVNEPEELASEDAVGASEQPTERQQERERAIADEPVAESEQRIAEAAAPEPTEAEEAEEDFVEERPRVKPEIPGADLEVDIVREDDAYRAESRWSAGRGKKTSSVRPLIV